MPFSNTKGNRFLFFQVDTLQYLPGKKNHAEFSFFYIKYKESTYEKLAFIFSGENPPENSMFTVYPIGWDTFITDIEQRVEHQERNQLAAEKWPFGFVFVVLLGLSAKIV